MDCEYPPRYLFLKAMDASELSNVYKELSLINEKQEQRVQLHQTESQQITIAYLLFQCIVLISISQSTNQQCKNWWIYFTLCLLCSIIYFLTLSNSITKYYRTRYQLDLNRMEQETIQRRMYEIRSHAIDVNGKMKEGPSKPDRIMLLRRKAYISIVVLALAGYTVLMLFSCHMFLCHGDERSAVS